MKNLFVLAVLLSLISCSNDDSVDDRLSTYISNEVIELEGVIACSASHSTDNITMTFFYPKVGASNYRLYETLNLDVDKNDFNNYKLLNVETNPVFNGYLRNFSNNFSDEKWVIVTYELNDEIKISNPIHIKQNLKPTVWNTNVSINLNQPQMPMFSWEDNAVGDNAIYFQVVSDNENNLLSGTYTYDNTFQYYDISNVVLNVTTQTPPNLEINSNYNFTMMDVSEDNWVNLVIEKSFTVQ